ALLDVGDPATVVVDALKGRTFSGSVSRLARAESATTRTMRVEIDLDNPSGLLCEGMYGRATIELRPAATKGLTVPAVCVIGHTRTGEAKAYVIRDGHLKSANLTLGDDDGNTTEVLTGIGADDGSPVSPNVLPPPDRPH